MKTLRNLFFISSFFSVVLLLTAMAAPEVAKNAGDIEFYLQNKCTRDVSYAVKLPSKVEKGTLSKGEKKKLCFAPGTEIDVDGEFFMKLAAGDDGETFIVCR